MYVCIYVSMWGIDYIIGCEGGCGDGKCRGDGVAAGDVSVI